MRILAVLVLCTLAWGAAAVAAEPEKPWSVGLDVSGAEETDFQDIPGDLSTGRTKVRFDRRLGDEEHRWIFRAAYEGSSYDFGDGTLGGSDQFDTNELALGGVYAATPEDGHAWFVVLNALSGTDDEASFSDGGYGRVGGGVAFKVNPKLRLGFAVVATTLLEEDPDVIAAPLVDWRINEKNRIGFVRSADPSIGYTYLWNDALDLYVSLNRDLRQFRIDEDTLDNAAIVDDERSLRVGLIWTPNTTFTGELFVGAAQRTLELDVDDDEVQSEDLDAGGMGGISATIHF